jgi:hypothetical protein
MNISTEPNRILCTTMGVLLMVLVDRRLPVHVPEQQRRCARQNAA